MRVYEGMYVCVSRCVCVMMETGLRCVWSCDDVMFVCMCKTRIHRCDKTLPKDHTTPKKSHNCSQEPVHNITNSLLLPPTNYHGNRKVTTQRSY